MSRAKRFSLTQFLYVTPGMERKLISVVSVEDHPKFGPSVFFISEVEHRLRQPMTPSHLSRETFDNFFGVNADEYRPA